MFDEAFRRDGMLVIDRLFAPEMIDRVRVMVQGWTGPIDPAAPPPHLSVDDLRLHFPVRLEGALLDPGLLFHPLLEAMLGNLLGEDYLIDNASVVNALAGAPMMHLHRDHHPLFAEVATENLPPYALTLVVPLVATDEASGTTMVARGSMASKRTGDESIEPPPDWVVPHVPLGGAFLMDIRTWHRGLPNGSASERPLLYVMFSRPWFSDTVNFNRHARMTIARADLVALPPPHRYRLRRAAAAGLIDDTVIGLGVKPPGWRDDSAGISGR